MNKRLRGPGCGTPSPSKTRNACAREALVRPALSRRSFQAGHVKKPDLLCMRPVERTNRLGGGLQQNLAALLCEISLGFRREMHIAHLARAENELLASALEDELRFVFREHVRGAVVLLRQLFLPLHHLAREANDHVVLIGLSVDRDGSECGPFDLHGLILVPGLRCYGDGLSRYFGSPNQAMELPRCNRLTTLIPPSTWPLSSVRQAGSSPPACLDPRSHTCIGSMAVIPPPYSLSFRPCAPMLLAGSTLRLVLSAAWRPVVTGSAPPVSLQRMASPNYVLDPPTTLINRRARRAKTDRLDAIGMLRVLAAYLRGDRQSCSMVRVPTPEDEDAKRIHRERENLVQDKLRIENRIEALLFTQGIRKRP